MSAALWTEEWVCPRPKPGRNTQPVLALTYRGIALHDGREGLFKRPAWAITHIQTGMRIGVVIHLKTAGRAAHAARWFAEAGFGEFYMLVPEVTPEGWTAPPAAYEVLRKFHDNYPQPIRSEDRELAARLLTLEGR